MRWRAGFVLCGFLATALGDSNAPGYLAMDFSVQTPGSVFAMQDPLVLRYQVKNNIANSVTLSVFTKYYPLAQSALFEGDKQIEKSNDVDLNLAPVITLTPTQLTVPRGATETVTVTIHPTQEELEVKKTYRGYIVFQEQAAPPATSPVNYRQIASIYVNTGKPDFGLLQISCKVFGAPGHIQFNILNNSDYVFSPEVAVSDAVGHPLFNSKLMPVIQKTSATRFLSWNERVKGPYSIILSMPDHSWQKTYICE